MTATPQFVSEPAGRVPVVASADLVVVGGGPAGIAAALAGARNGLSVTLLERYPYLGGLPSGGKELVLDDMCNGQAIAAPIQRCGANGRVGACSISPRT